MSITLTAFIIGHKDIIQPVSLYQDNLLIGESLVKMRSGFTLPPECEKYESLCYDVNLNAISEVSKRREYSEKYIMLGLEAFSRYSACCIENMNINDYKWLFDNFDVNYIFFDNESCIYDYKKNIVLNSDQYVKMYDAAIVLGDEVNDDRYNVDIMFEYIINHYLL